MTGSGLLLVFIFSLFFQGILNRVKSLSSGRRGPGIFQAIKDILRLLQKQTIYSNTSSVIFRIAPSVYFASILCALLVLPFGSNPAIISFKGDFIFFIYVLALGKFMMIVSALDTGSPFEGMGANREALYSMLAEPAFFILIGAFAMATGYTSFYEIYNHIDFSNYMLWLLAGLSIYILIQIAMIENSRLPVDDPKTHLELTMVHEVMILDNSGFDLGMIMYGTALKFVMFGLLMTNFILMPSMNFITQVGVFFGVQIVWAIIAGLLESFRARERMKKNPQYIFSLLIYSMLVFFGVTIIYYNF
ncbi:MAG: respiratory chain complex I subunit 1 family protein [Cytophagaceae bacterium]